MFHSVCGFQGTCAYAPSAYAMGLSGLEPPTSRLSGVRSNRLSYKPAFFFFKSGIHLLFHTVSSIVPSAAYVLTVVFGMGTGVPHKRINTRCSSSLLGYSTVYKTLTSSP